MAHLGKTYPVHFRRDFNIDVLTNDVGIAKAYAWSSTSAGGTVGRALPGKRFICIAQDEVTFPGAKWQSAFQSVGGRSISILIVCDPAEVNKGIVARGQVIDSSAGAIGQFACSRPLNRRYGNLAASLDAQFTPRRDLLEPNNTTIGFLAAILWPEWNNL